MLLVVLIVSFLSPALLHGSCYLKGYTMSFCSVLACFSAVDLAPFQSQGASLDGVLRPGTNDGGRTSGHWRGIERSMRSRRRIQQGGMLKPWSRLS